MNTNDAEEVRSSVEIRAEMDGRDPDEYQPQVRRRSRDRSGPKFRSGVQPRTRKHAQASERSSLLAQQWVDAGAAAGFEFPYDVNYFALALQRKVERDPEMRDLLLKDEHEKVERWVAKMVERWWAEYVSNDIDARNAKEYFLVTDWEDLREYARTCLRAAYLVKHGKPRRATQNVDGLIAGRELQESLARMAAEQQVATYVEKTLSVEQAPLELDPKGRDRLRSWREKRSKK